jgi:hypothetical protein
VTTTPETIAELKRLMAQATPGPWSVRGKSVEAVDNGMMGTICQKWDSHTIPDATQDTNMELIVAAFNSLPALLADIDMLREALQAISQRHPGYGGSGDIARKALADTEVQP